MKNKKVTPTPSISRFPNWFHI